MLEAICALAIGYLMGREKSKPTTVIIREETPPRISYGEEDPKKVFHEEEDYDVEVNTYEDEPKEDEPEEYRVDLLTEQKRSDFSSDMKRYIDSRLHRYYYAQGYIQGNDKDSDTVAYMKGFKKAQNDRKNGGDDYDDGGYFYWSKVHYQEWGWKDAMNGDEKPTFSTEEDYMTGWMEGLKDRSKIES